MEKNLNVEIKQLTKFEEVLDFEELIKELLEHSDQGKISSSFNTLKIQGVEFIGVYLKNIPVGFAQYIITTNLENYKQLRLDEIVVSSQFRGSGVGKFIMTHLEKIAKKNDCRVMFLATSIRNSKAQKFYLNLGFAVGSFYMYKQLIN